MYTIHEGEILFKEQYGTSGKSRFYVKPPEQEAVVTIDENGTNEFTNLFTKIFLPQGYPDSVSKDYLTYQLWDTAQAFCSTITGTIATQEVLRGVGVGDKHATPLAATFTWVLKDGCGHIGRILFAYTHGSVLDAYSKKWRLYADTLNDAAICMEMALPVFKHFTVVALCISTVMKALVGVAGGATRVAMTQHHAIRGNMADVAAKDSAQETAVNLIASIVALLILSVFGNSLILFTIVMIHHIIFNYLAVRAICLRTLNEPRFLQVIDAYLKDEIISTPCEINRNEPIVFYQMGANILDLKLCGFSIILGQSMQKIIAKNKHKPFYLNNIRDVYESNEYMLFPDMSATKMYIVIKETATISDILCAYFHAVLLSISICAINDHPLAIYKNFNNESRPFPQICRTLYNADWSRDDSEEPNSKFKQLPSVEMLQYIDTIVNKEWPHFKKGMLSIGWDLSKQLLVVDEWRVCNAKIVTKVISTSTTIDAPRAAESMPKLTPQVVTFDNLNSDWKDDVTLTDTIDTFTIEPDSLALESEDPKNK